MMSVSQSTAKILFLASLVIAGGSAWYGVQLAHKISSTQQGIKFAKQDQSQASTALQAMQKLLPGNEPTQLMDRAVENTVFTLQQARLNARVTLATLTPDAVSKGVAGAAVAPTSIGGTKLMAVTLNVKGTYADYEGLNSYLATIRALPVAITRLKIDGTNFDVSVLVFGKSE
jgi:hypothetical protein